MPTNRPAAMPIYQSSGWEFDDLAHSERVFAGAEPGVSYATLGSVPNNLALEKSLLVLHGAEDAVATCGGMAALAGVFRAHLRPGSRVVASRDLFGLTVALLAEFERWGVETVFVDFSDADLLESELEVGVDLILAETISNPLTRVAHLGRIVSAAGRHDALVVIDNTFAGPFHCRPLEHGVDIVIESVTKSLAGHHDVVLGPVLGSADLVEPARRILTRTAGIPAPFASWLGQRGMASYELRQQRASSNALTLARWLEAKPEVTAVHFPGLESHPDHTLAKEYLTSGFGSVLSIELAGGRERLDAFLSRLESVGLVMSLGGPVTTIAHPASMTHGILERSERLALGITDNLLRIALGLEPIDEILKDFGQALESVQARAAAAGDRPTSPRS